MNAKKLLSQCAIFRRFHCYHSKSATVGGIGMKSRPLKLDKGQASTYSVGKTRGSPLLKLNLSLKINFETFSQDSLSRGIFSYRCIPL